MGQSDILHFLSKDPERWYLANEISEGTHTNISSVQKALRKLAANREVLRKKLPYTTNTRAPFLYRYAEQQDQ